MTAPARPIASVPTGTPAGICTIESSESIPFSVFDSTGTPSTGSAVFAAAIPGRCAAPPAPAISTCSPRASADAGVLEEEVGRAVGRDDALLERDAERVERLGGVPHRLPVGAGAHDQADERRLGHERYFVFDFLTSSSETERAVFRTSASVSSSPAMPSRITIVSRAGVPFLKQTIASRRTATFGSRVASSWSSGR